MGTDNDKEYVFYIRCEDPITSEDHYVELKKLSEDTPDLKVYVSLKDKIESWFYYLYYYIKAWWRWSVTPLFHKENPTD